MFVLLTNYTYKNVQLNVKQNYDNYEEIQYVSDLLQSLDILLSEFIREKCLK